MGDGCVSDQQFDGGKAVGIFLDEVGPDRPGEVERPQCAKGCVASAPLDENRAWWLCDW